MRESVLVTDADLARARSDPAFRQQLLGDFLELLLAQLNKLSTLVAAMHWTVLYAQAERHWIRTPERVPALSSPSGTSSSRRSPRR